MEARQSIRLPARIREDRKGHREGLHEVSSHQSSAVADSHQLCAARVKFRHCFTETSHLLATEYSAKMPQKDQHRSLMSPRDSEWMRLTIESIDLDGSQALEVHHG